MKKILVILFMLFLSKISFATDVHAPSVKHIFDQGLDAKSNVTISTQSGSTPFIIQFNGTNYLVVSNMAIHVYKPLIGSGHAISNMFDFAIVPFTNNAVISWNSSIGKWTPIEQISQVDTSVLASIIYVDDATNIVRQTATNQADILMGLRTNGLASIIYVNSKTNVLATIGYVNTITNGLVSVIYTDNATNIIRQTATNQADILAGSRTNGLASITYVNSKNTNGIASIIYVNSATNTIRQTATNQADILAGLRTNGLASIIYVDAKTNGIASIIYADNATNTIRQTATNQSDILAGLRTNGLASIIYVDAKTNGIASVIYTDNATNTIRQTATNQIYMMMTTKLTNWPSFRVCQVTNQSLAASTITKITFTNLIFEYGQSSGFGWDSTTYSYRPPIAGRYRFSLTTYTHFPFGVPNNYQGSLFCTNNNTSQQGRYWLAYQYQGQQANSYIITGSRQFDLTTNDVISAYIYSGGTTGSCNSTTANPSNVINAFDGELLVPIQ